MKFTAFTCALLFTLSAHAQSTFLPKNLGAGVNSAYDEVSPVISSDRKTILFNRKNHPMNGFGEKNSTDIWISNLQADGTWSEAERSPSLNISQHNIILSITADGHALLLSTDEGLSLSIWQNEAWSAPQKLNIKGSDDAALSADGKYLLVRKHSKLLVYERGENGSLKEPITVTGLKAKVKTPFLLIDNKTLYFSSSTKGKGTDLFRVKRLNDEWSAWSAPEALNDTINTAGDETYLRTSLNGAWGYYSSTNNSTGKGDIFMAKLFEDQPYVLVTGKVINAKTKRVLTNKDIQILADGKPTENIVFNRDSATFQAKLPFGKKYTLSASLYQYGAKPYIVDATHDKEFRYINTDLEEEPVPFVLLKGKLLIKNTDQAIPASALAKIMVDGEEIDSAHVDLEKGTYSIKLNHGTVYYVQVSARRFESLPDLVDLKGVDGYEEVTLDLQADAEKMAIVTGRIINKKTNNTLPPEISTGVKVEGVSSVAAIVDSLQSVYELRFPLRASYTLSAVASGFYPLYENIDLTQESNEVTINRDLTLVPFERGQSVLLKNIFFKPDNVTLDATSYPELDRLILFLTANPKVKIEIGAHADPSSKVSTLNQAKAVANYITAQGIAKNRITSRGYGASKPVASSKTPEGKAQNRRIEFTFTEK
ncbi:MAG TPA: OmpA family protein [Ohtaekwangia sp.]|uniref:OmpA family protein n=1 Tax=Ohtaekwangia sp. TaxID=2066019 RepID=UPI002F95253E